MKTFSSLILLPVFAFGLSSCTGNGHNQTSDEVIFNEVDGILAVEAESFYKQDQDETRRWYRIDGVESPQVGRDDDPSHAATSSGGAYLEILPDTRVTHDDELIRGENFSNEAGQMAILYYKVNINEPGRYYV